MGGGAAQDSMTSEFGALQGLGLGRGVGEVRERCLGSTLHPKLCGTGADRHPKG